MRYTVTQFARESVGLCPFRDSYVRECELSHSNPGNRVIKITQAYNLHVKAVNMFHVVHQIHVFWGVGGGEAVRKRSVELCKREIKACLQD